MTSFKPKKRAYTHETGATGSFGHGHKPRGLGDRQQAGATLEAIANSIEKFAVTPERLRETLEESQQAFYERIKEETDRHFEVVNQRFESVDQRFDAVNQRFDDVNERFNDLNRRLDDVLAEQRRADSSKLFNLVLAIALGIAGVAGIWLTDQLF